MQMPNNELTFHVDEASAPIVRDAFELGANVTGRVTFDDAEAWGGDDPMGIPSFIVTHEVPRSGATATPRSRSSPTASRVRSGRPRLSPATSRSASPAATSPCSV